MAAGGKNGERQTGLTGMKSICDAVGRSEATVLKLIREENFPAVKIGGVWESDLSQIDEWRREKIAERRHVGA